MTYQVRLRPSAERDLRSLPTDIRRRLLAEVEALAENPRPAGAKRLSGELAGSYRLKVRRIYRVGFDVDDAAHVVTVWGVGHRDKFYERAKRQES